MIYSLFCQVIINLFSNYSNKHYADDLSLENNLLSETIYIKSAHNTFNINIILYAVHFIVENVYLYNYISNYII